MFPISYKTALKKMGYYNLKSNPASGSIYNKEEEVTAEAADIPKQPTTYFESQKDIHKWIEQAEAFSSKKKEQF